jgi:hypothetical protein
LLTVVSHFPPTTKVGSERTTEVCRTMMAVDERLRTVLMEVDYYL